jgi:DNA-binding MarR family transcriptional regulator
VSLAAPSLSTLTPAQARTYGLVLAQPGLTIMEAAKLLGCTHATATYHLNLLLQRGFIACQRDGREVRHFTTAGDRNGSQYLQALCRDPRRDAVARHVAGLLAPASVNEVARALGITFGFAKRTLAQFEADGLVRIERRRIWYLVSPTPRLMSALGLLAKVQVSAPAGQAALEGVPQIALP